MTEGDIPSESYCTKSKKKFGDEEVIGGVFLCEQRQLEMLINTV